MESNPPAMAKRLWHVVRIVYCMFRKGVSKRKLMMDLHFILKRSKIAGKAIGNLMFHAGNHHHHHHHHHHEESAFSGFSCRSMDPNMAFYNPREVEFSCSNTPSYTYFHAGSKRKHRHRRSDYHYDASALQKAFDLLNSPEVSDFADVTAPSPMPLWAFGKSPMVRQLRITDSPFPIREEEGDVDSDVDREAEEFIGRFYEQLRLQHQMAARYRHGQTVYG